MVFRLLMTISSWVVEARDSRAMECIGCSHEDMQECGDLASTALDESQRAHFLSTVQQVGNECPGFFHPVTESALNSRRASKSQRLLLTRVILRSLTIPADLLRQFDHTNERLLQVLAKTLDLTSIARIRVTGHAISS